MHSEALYAISIVWWVLSWAKNLVSSTHAHDRNEKEVQVGHRLKFEFKLKIVDDKHEWIEEDNKKKSKITEGKKISYSEDAIRFIAKRTRSKKKR